MAEHGAKFVRGSIPEKVEKLENGNKKVYWTDPESKELKSEEFETVLFAIGRTADTNNIGLEKLGVALDKSSKKIIVKDDDSTNVENIFAIGDVAKGRPELTPTAIMAGRLLARRLFNYETKLMDYRNVATTVFTPLEYGCIGYSEDEAVEKFGADALKIYAGDFKPLEWSYLETHSGHSCYVKIICDAVLNRKIIGLHYLGPNAGEVV